MKSKFLGIILILLPSIALSQGLEINYPIISGIQPTRASPYLYTTYIFYFSLAVVGIIALISLIFSGLQYLSSAGDAQVKKKSKERILAAFFGIIILVFGLLVLRTIKREHVFIPEVTLPEISMMPILPAEEEIGSDPIQHIHMTARDMLLAITTLNSIRIPQFKSYLENCTCGNARSLCAFNVSSCLPLKCTGDPCPQRDNIRNEEIAIRLKVEEILFYGRLLEDAKENLKPEILGKEPSFDLKARLGMLKDVIEELKPLLQQLKEKVFSLTPLAHECKDADSECDASCELISNDFPKCKFNNCEPTDKQLCPMDEVNDLISEINHVVSEIQGRLLAIIAFRI